MSVRAVAKAAYDASKTDTADAARQAMIAVLGDPNAEFSTITLAEVQAPPQVPYTLVVFDDADSDVVLGVRQREGSADWEMWLLEPKGDGSGEWGFLGEQVKSLEHLWVLIDTHMPAAAAWSGDSVAYAVGDQVTYNGATYECIQAHTSQATWTPAASPSLWSVA